MSFLQTPPQLAHPYRSDRVLQSCMRRLLPHALADEFDRCAMELGQLVAEDLYPQQLAERLVEPRLVQWDAWGRRIDRIELTPLWQRMPEIVARHGLVWHGYDKAKGAHARVFQFGLVYLYTPASDFYACPLAMTDGAARVLIESGNKALIQRAVPRLSSRDRDSLWTCGQWMTETTGGSDVSRSETRAEQDAEGQWRLHGRKWFTSAATSEASVLLARPAGNPAGADGLALYYLEPRDRDGHLRQIEIDRLKDKLGSRKLPTAELRLFGAPAELIGARDHGVRAIAPLLNVTRVWNSIAAVSYFRRGLQLLRDYAERREVFGSPLRDRPLHKETLAGLQAEFEAGFHLSFYIVELLGKAEQGQLDERQRLLLRLLTPVAKLLTAKQAVAGLSEVVEGFGGAGYVEDTGIPGLLRDAQVFSIWEGTTNVLALDVLRVLRGAGGLGGVLSGLLGILGQAGDEQRDIVRAVRETFESAQRWLVDSESGPPEAQEAGARELAITIGRAFALALLARHAGWALRAEGDPRPAAAARRFLRHGINRLGAAPLNDSTLLAWDQLP